MKKILHIHGFLSSSRSFKAALLKKYFGEKKVIAPDIPAVPQKAYDFLKKIIIDENVKLIIGSSLGGFYAMLLSVEFKLPAVLINPSLKPFETLAQYTGQTLKNFHTGKSVEWNEEYIYQLKNLYEKGNLKNLNEKKLHFFLAKDDEILDHSTVSDLFPGANIYFFENAGHNFIIFEDIIPKINDLWKNSE